MRMNNFKCKHCNFEDKDSKNVFCDICNELFSKFKKIGKEIDKLKKDNLSEIDFIKNNLKKENLIFKKEKIGYLLKLRGGLNQQLPRRSIDLEILYNELEKFTTRNPETIETYHCVNRFDILPKKSKAFIYSSLSSILFNATNKITPEKLHFLLKV